MTAKFAVLVEGALSKQDTIGLLASVASSVQTTLASLTCWENAASEVQLH